MSEFIISEVVESREGHWADPINASQRLLGANLTLGLE
eukprot:CAMPEP_0170304452 /NCGR_PEP_ID=MMETSP0116_2-20130129/52571_1 /TAXON_ID=400756 /ORGANISM="Durinskia baltica, Strain CSIRO CS-38" /LENGTH=37 /DNA_ID= /DNA_START= /DNA_END= /DNA_ORIENTATION=